MRRILKRLLGLHRPHRDVDLTATAAASVERRQADADRRLKAVEAQTRVVAHR